MSNYTPEQIQFILAEIEQWRKDGLLTERGAQILRRRYEQAQAALLPPEASLPSAPPPAPFSIAESVSASSVPPPSVSSSVPPSVAESVPPSSAPSSAPLASVLLSEASIKVALYLGAFFVIAAGLILAALVETLRLPLLLGVAALFGGGALALKKRLPQPSFILWLVFSALLPISASVLADLLDLRGPPLSVYWAVVGAAMTALWAFSTWLYVSRFFSLAAFGALVFAAWHVANSFEPQGELYWFALAAAGLFGLAGVFLLKKWQSQRFALPLYWLAQAIQIIVLALAALSSFYNFFTNYDSAWWLFAALTWATAFLFYAASDLLIPFPLFRFMAAAALMPVAWLALNEARASNTVFAFGWWGWALTLLLGGEIALSFKTERVTRFSLPLGLASIPLFFIAGLVGVIENAWLGFGLFAASGLALTLAHLRRARWWMWTPALGLWVLAWFFFFNLPPVQRLNVHSIVIFSGLLLPLSLLDWLLRGRFAQNPTWRWPLRLFALAALVIAIALSLFASPDDRDLAALAFGLFALLGLGYALRFWQPGFLPAFTASLAVSLLYALAHFNLTWWLPALTILAVGYYASGYLLSLRDKQGHWANALRSSGLGLGLLASLSAGFYSGPGDGWYVGVLGILFVIETFARLAWLELAVHGLYVLAITLILAENEVASINPYLMGISVILLGLDMFFERALRGRSSAKVLPRLAGGLTVLLGNLSLLSEWQSASGLDIAVSLTFTLLLLGYALFYRKPDLSFLFYASTAVTALLVAGFAGLQTWTGVIILLGLALYLLGFVDKPLGWGQPRRLSGLLLATAAAISTWFEAPGLWGSLQAAVTASVWAIEAFRRRNVWLGFPTNGFYLMAYFILLQELNVSEPQFFSVGAALLGLLMHYLLARSGAKTGAFLTGMVSQLILLGTSYIQMAANNSLAYFIALFFQSIVVMVYGLVFRSRSLVFTPILLVVMGVVTVVFSILRGLATVLVIGCTGLLFIALGILAVWQRERLADWRERISGWNA